MRIRKNKFKKIYLIFALFFILSLTIFIANITPGLKGSLEQEVRIFLKQPLLTNEKNFQSIIKNLFPALKNKIFREAKLDTLYLQISYSNLKILKEDRKKALKKKALINKKKVPLKIKWMGKNYEGSARLKGKLSDHWGNNKQYSLWIKLKDGKTINGFNEFSITQHASREFPINQIISSNLEKLGVASPRYKTVKIDLNGDDWGVMLVEEQFSKPYFELRKLKYSPIIKLTNAEDFNLRAIFSSSEGVEYEEIKALTNWQGKLEIKVFNRNDFDDFYFAKLISMARSINELVYLEKIDVNKVENYFNLELLAKVFASSLIFGDFHSLVTRNIRFYLNPYTAKLEPIPSDHGSSFREIENLDLLKNEINDLINCKKNCRSAPLNLYRLLLSSDEFNKHYLVALNEFEKLIPNIKKDTQIICKYYTKTCSEKVNLKVIEKNIDFLKKTGNKFFGQKYYTKNEKNIIVNKNKLNDLKSRYLKNSKYIAYVRAYKNGKLKIYNLSPYKISLNKIQGIKKYDDTFVNILEKNIILNKSSIEHLSIKEHDLEKDLKNFSFLKLKFKMDNNLIKSITVPVEDTISENEFKNSVNYKIPKFIEVNNNTYIIKSGKWILKDPLILPKNFSLKILSGSQISFGQEAYIHLDGGKLEILGTLQDPVILNASDKHWKGILVSNSKNKVSKINYTNILNTNYFSNNFVKLTGGVNFYKSDVSIENSSFKNSLAEDALNIVKSKYNIKYSDFSDHKSDAFDSDFSNGNILNSKFTNIKGDAVDFSGTNTLIKEVFFENINDKAISAGEKSKVQVNNLKILNSKVGIASKDSSILNGEQIFIQNSRLADIAAFKKKDYFKGGKINLNNLEQKKLMILAQKGSKIIIDSKIVPITKFETKIFY